MIAQVIGTDVGKMMSNYFDVLDLTPSAVGMLSATIEDSFVLPYRNLDAYRAMGLKIKIARRFRGLTQLQLAERVQSCPSTISKLENGKRRGETMLVYAIAYHLGVDINSLLPGIKTS